MITFVFPLVFCDFFYFPSFWFQTCLLFPSDVILDDFHRIGPPAALATCAALGLPGFRLQRELL